MIPVGEDVLKRQHKTILLLCRTQITSRLRFFSKLRKGNIDIALFTTRYQSIYSRTHTWQYSKCSEKKQIIDITLMKICITNTVVEVDPSAKTFKENLYRGGGVLILVAPLLIRLQYFPLQPWLLQCNHRTPSAQLICITIISINV